MDPNKIAEEFYRYIKNLSGWTVISQGYCLSSLQQENINITSYSICENKADIEALQKRIEQTIFSIKENANDYLTILINKLIASFSMVNQYYDLHISMPEKLATVFSAKVCLEILQPLRDIASQYKAAADKLSIDIRTFRGKLNENIISIQQILIEFCQLTTRSMHNINAVEEKLMPYQQEIIKIETEITEQVIGLENKAFSLFIGPYEKIRTTSTNVNLVIGGNIAMSPLVAECIPSVEKLACAIKSKGLELKSTNNMLLPEERLLLSIQTGLSLLDIRMIQAFSTSVDISNCWNSIFNYLDRLYNRMNSGRISIEDVVKFFADEGNTPIKALQKNIPIVEKQTKSVNIIRARFSQTLFTILPTQYTQGCRALFRI